jgi:hypothetical protein
MWRMGCICTMFKAFIGQIIADANLRPKPSWDVTCHWLVALGTACKSQLQGSGSPFFLGCLIPEDGVDRPARNVRN